MNVRNLNSWTAKEVSRLKEKYRPQPPPRFKRNCNAVTIHWIIEKAREFQKNIWFIDCTKVFDYVGHRKLWKILKHMEISDHLTCLLWNLYADQEAAVRTRHGTTDWFRIGKGVHQGCILSSCLFNSYAEYFMLDWMKHKLESRLLGEISITSDTQMTPPLMVEGEEELKSLLMKVKEESEKAGLKLNIQNVKIMASGPLTSWQIDGEPVTDYFGGSKITTYGDCSHEIKRCLLLGRIIMTNLDSMLKSRDITLLTKVCLVKAVVFPVIMYGCESWMIKKAECWSNWWFWSVVLEKSLESPLDCKKIQPVHPKGNQSWIFFGRTDAEAPILWPPDEKNWLLGKDPNAGKDWRQEEKGTSEDEMVGWHHWLNGHEFEQALGVGNGQGSLVCCSLWVCRVGHDWATELNWYACSNQ